MTAIEVGVYSARHGAVPIKVTEQWVVAVSPMIFNDRITLTARDEWDANRGYTAGWCYDKGPAAAIAGLMWDPDTEREPAGYKKRACDARPPD